MTLKRPCLDPWYINKLLPDDQYPIPLIKDIFNVLARAVIFIIHKESPLTQPGIFYILPESIVELPIPEGQQNYVQ